MRVEFSDKQSDHSGPVIDLISENEYDAFLLGVLFEKLVQVNACVWKFMNTVKLRLPLVMMNEIGLALTYINPEEKAKRG